MTALPEPLELLKRTLLSANNEGLLATVAARSAEILAQLDSDGAEPTFESVLGSLEGIDKRWLATVYEALAAGDLRDVAPGALDIHQQADEEIGSVFAGVLLRSLPPVLRTPHRWLELVDNVPTGAVSELRMRTDVRAATAMDSDALERLLWKGVTPLSIFHASEAFSMLAHRAGRNMSLSESNPLSIDIFEGRLEATPDPIRAETVIQEIADMVDCNSDVARGLCHWILPVACLCPQFVNGIRIVSHSLKVGHCGIAFLPDRLLELPLAQRWRCAAGQWANVQNLKTAVESTMTAGVIVR